jgi:hypothetical protein
MSSLKDFCFWLASFAHRATNVGNGSWKAFFRFGARIETREPARIEDEDEDENEDEIQMPLKKSKRQRKI